MSSGTGSLDTLADTGTEQLGRRSARIMAIGIGRERAVFAVATVLSLLYGVTTVANSWALSWATDHVITPSFKDGRMATGALWTAVALFCAIAVLQTAGVVGRRLAGGIVYQRLVREDRRRVTRAYLRLPLRWHQRHPAGQLLSNANADVEATWGVFMPLPMAIGVIAMLVTALVTMVLADPVLTIVGLVVFPLLFVVNAVYQRVTGPRYAHAQSLRGDLSSVAHESFDGALVVKSLGREADETARFARVTEQLRDANVAVGRVRAVFDPLVDALPNLAVLVVLWLGAARVVSGATGAADVVQVAYLFTLVGFPVRAFGWVLGEVPRSVVGWDRVQNVLTEPDHLDYGNERLTGSGAVRVDVEHLTFAHPDGVGAPVLRNLQFGVPAGTVTAVVGATGSGKSTLMSLVTRLMDPDTGVVRYDGRDVRDLSASSLTGTAALVAQSTFVFDDTVRANIALDLPVADDHVWEVLRAVRADRFVAALPDGLDTRLGERGTSLSGGQRQRIALARALVRDPRFLVMDDATSALDPQVEQQILRGLAARSADGTGPTVLVVAYRKATIALADTVLHLAGGRIVGRGTDAQLRATSETYRELVDAYDIAREDTDHEDADDDE